MVRTDGQISLYKKIRILSVLIFVGACSTSRPNLEYVLAREAFASAKEVDAAKYAPGYFHKAEEAYRNAQGLYKDQKYSEAAQEFKNSRYNAERAETSARYLRQKAGDEEL